MIIVNGASTSKPSTPELHQKEGTILTGNKRLVFPSF
jgi:hypothetical protein